MNQFILVPRLKESADFISFKRPVVADCRDILAGELVWLNVGYYVLIYKNCLKSKWIHIAFFGGPTKMAHIKMM
ncbi:hypothetical protein DSCW_04570 [Desulfosarcina widdelii]|uniref:Uncharacterized protein n=1 Tax=Desulfosarcina widdelii TaxID=947919 RepID=A0A5K7YXH2_9BACT|nr:hypothetical protein DSCW_04570 [Desulfosarcina widdelii]